MQSSTSVTFAWNISGELDAAPDCNLSVFTSSNTLSTSILNTSTSNSSSTSYTLTISTGTYYWNVSCTDHASKLGASTTRTFTIDNTSDTLAISSPTSGQSFYGPALLNWTASGSGSNMSSVGYYLDNQVFVFLLGPTSSHSLNGTHLLNTSGGSHTIIFSMNDSANNWANSSSISFTITIENLSETGNEIQGNNPAVNGTSWINSSGQFVNGSIDLNQSILLQLVLDDILQDIIVKIPFNGSNADWNKSSNFSVDINTSGPIADQVGNKSGVNVTRIAFFRDFDYFLNLSDYNNISLIFNSSPTGLVVLYVADDDGNEVYKLSQCSGNTPPAAVISTSNMCYTNQSQNTTLHIPHLSGGALANDTVEPTVNISNPANNSVIANGDFYLRFDVWEANPATTFCRYNVTNGTTTATSGTLADSDATQTGTQYTFAVLLSQLPNYGYNVTINCSDANNRSTRLYHNFTLTDTTTTNMTSISGGSPTSTATTITWTTGDYANSTVNYGTTTSLGTYAGSETFELSHSVSLSGLTASTLYYFRAISCDINANCNTSDLYNFTTTAAASSSTSSSSSSGGGGGGTTTETPSVSKQWDTIPQGSITTYTISNSLIPVTKLTFTVLQKLSNAQLTVKALDTKPSATSTLQSSMYSKVYKYLEFVKANIADASVTNIQVEFTVPVSWLNSNSIDSGQIVLLRWNNNAWQELVTRKIKSDSTIVTYTASTPGFSYFAIAAKAQAAAPAEQAPGEEPTTDESATGGEIAGEATAAGATSGQPATTTTTTATGTTGSEPAQGKSTFLLWSVIILALIGFAVAGYYFVYMKQHDMIDEPGQEEDESQRGLR